MQLNIRPAIALLTGSALALAFPFGGCRRAPLTIDEIITRHTEAIGGKAAIESIQSLRADLHIVDPGFEVDGIYRAARPGRMRIDVSAEGKHVFTEAFNGTRGWQWKGEGDAVEAKPEATAALRRGVELPGKIFGLHELRGRGHKLSLSDREQIDGKTYYVLKLTFSDGYTTSLYIDPETWLITRRRDYRPLHPDVDPRPTTIESVFSDFRTINGVQFSFKNVDTDLQTGRVLETATVKQIVVNPTIEDSAFDRL
ncbi:MAG TPA: hypothetical protein VJ719_09015 [Chthoniobacterales bacterium]|nr:hypothetical protein [Chthoniobacterales bacterium]